MQDERCLRLFYVALILFLVYHPHHLLGADPAAIEEQEQGPAVLAEETTSTPSVVPWPSLAGNPQAIAAGKRIFMIHCYKCHGHGGRGGIGPNLTDDVTLHVNSYQDVVNVVTNGVPGRPMNAWKSILDATRIRQVAAYVYSLKGTRPTQKQEKPFALM